MLNGLSVGDRILRSPYPVTIELPGNISYAEHTHQKAALVIVCYVRRVRMNGVG